MPQTCKHRPRHIRVHALQAAFRIEVHLREKYRKDGDPFAYTNAQGRSGNLDLFFTLLAVESRWPGSSFEDMLEEKRKTERQEVTRG